MAGIVEYKLSEWMINPGEISLDEDDRISMRVKRNISKKLRRSWEDIHILPPLLQYLSHIKIWRDFLKKDGNYCLVISQNGKKHSGQDFEKFVFSEKFDILLLDYKNIESDETVSNRDIISVTSFNDLSSYIISRDCITKLMKYVYPVQVKIDSFICIYKEIFGLKIIAFKTRNFNQKDQLKFLEEECALCDLPDDWNINNVLIENWDYYLGRTIQCGVILAGIFVLASPNIFRIKLR